MNRILAIAVVLYLLGDPGLTLLKGLVDNGEAVMAAVITLLMSPWLRMQFDH